MRDGTRRALEDELSRARSKFPGPHDTAAVLIALVEEVGEVSRALLEGDADGVVRESLQVACLAVRIVEETNWHASSMWRANSRNTGEDGS